MRGEPSRKDLARTARRRLFSFVNCNQATISTQRDHLGVTLPMLLKASSHLEGGCFSHGSTCGVVSGGCLALALRHLADLREGNPGKIAAFHELTKEYTSWFAATFGSTICRERTGCSFTTLGGMVRYALGGRFLRCVAHTGRAACFLAELEERPLGEVGSRGPGDPFHCSREVLRRLRGATGAGDDSFEALYVCMDGGVGLSGGLCGAAAAGMLPLGWLYGLDPEEAGFAANLAAFTRGHRNIFRGREERELFSLGDRFIRGWLAEFGSLECRDLTGRRFGSWWELADFAREAEVCARAREYAMSAAMGLLA